MELASLAQLERSHRRHDDVMAGLLEAARRLAAGRPDDGDVQRVHDAVAYFERAVTRHFLDEEGSVFPRLSTRRPELATELATLSAEHPAQIALQAEVAAAARELDGEARPSAGMALLDAATRLAEMHRAHVAREDEIFQQAHDALTTQDDLEISTEMETRRDREDEPGMTGGRGRGGRGGGGGGGGGRGRGMGGGGDLEPTSRRAPTLAAIPAAIARKASEIADKATAVMKSIQAIATNGKPTAKPAGKAIAKPAAKQAASTKPAKKAPATKASAKQAPANKAPANKAPANKAPANRAPAKKSAAKRAPVKKSPANKASANKSPANKASANKSPAKKSPANKRR